MTTRICSVSGCECKHYAKGFCQRHYERSRERKTTVSRPYDRRTGVGLRHPLSLRLVS